jgi:GrpB-like predicted nucleotidyltransferase (UPF0157 family)
MIGLKRNTVRLVEHDPDWAELAAIACRDVREASGELIVEVQHVGSTAVPDLPAKPILDIAAAVGSFELLPELTQRLVGIGYVYRHDSGDEGGHLLAFDSAPEIRMIHLHVVEWGSTQWRNYLRFRDLLRQSPEIRQSYAQLKRDLASTWPGDRESYTAGKADFIRQVLKTI